MRVICGQGYEGKAGLVVVVVVVVVVVGGGGQYILGIDHIIYHQFQRFPSAAASGGTLLE